MDEPEAKTFSFIIKIWIQELAEGENRTTWHGHITHVPSGERRYLKELCEIVDFIQPYLEANRVRPGCLMLLRRWLRRTSISRKTPG